MATTIHLTLRKDKTYKNGESPIYLRVTHNRKVKWWSTGVSLKKSDWNDEKEKVRRSHPGYKKLNDHLTRQKTEARNIELDLKKHDDFSLKKLKRKISGRNDDDFFVFAESYLQELQDADRYWPYRHAKVIVNKVEDFQGGKELRLSQIDADWLDDLKAFLSKPKSKGGKYENSQNTLAKNFERLKAILNKAVERDYLKENPFKEFDRIKRVKTTKEKIFYKDFKAIEDLDLEGGSDLWHTRNYFMFSFFNAGIRFGDLCCLRWSNIQRNLLRYKMNKTGKEKEEVLTPQSKKILNHYRDPEADPEDYIFPILKRRYKNDNSLKCKQEISSRNVLVNKDLKDIAEMAGVEVNLSFHVSRHSYALYLLENGADISDISKALGHSSIQQTETYLRSDEYLNRRYQEMKKDLFQEW